MSRRKSSIPFFTDNDVPDDVGRFLWDSGHDVTRLRDVMLDSSADPVVAAACRQQGLVLITHNVKHFRAIVRDHEVTRGQVDTLNRIEMGCKQIRSKARMEAALSLIEAEWARAEAQKTGMRIWIGDEVIRIHR
ncbi:hypothetical protein GR702_05445 [Novosphingobium sp. FGD1]|uniref:DUF5615 domain-containing protein n=1 Tax=Novosphingobium silvae TaxID=2692619 RepID=A0A7X4GEL9_9SPHN|nr:DUF5615 family PIN-like protein [Novosphingobium silvae]MYL97215.1 hypothetical protein [Novosphingobium silvae]